MYELLIINGRIRLPVPIPHFIVVLDGRNLPNDVWARERMEALRIIDEVRKDFKPYKGESYDDRELSERIISRLKEASFRSLIAEPYRGELSDLKIICAATHLLNNLTSALKT